MHQSFINFRHYRYGLIAAVASLVTLVTYMIDWPSAHVYLGLAALLIATLHSGMHFGRNVHTVAYVLMCLVTLSGRCGVYAYVSFPGAMMQQRVNLRRSEFLRQIAELDSSSLELAEGISSQMTQLLAEAARRTD